MSDKDCVEIDEVYIENDRLQGENDDLQERAEKAEARAKELEGDTRRLSEQRDILSDRLDAANIHKLKDELDTLKAHNDRLTAALEEMRIGVNEELAELSEYAEGHHDGQNSCELMHALRVDIPDRIETYLRGFNKALSKDTHCQECQGTGKKWVQQRYTDGEYSREECEDPCEECKGKGVELYDNDAGAIAFCNECGGRGSISAANAAFEFEDIPCPKCKGKGE